jgi:hypothetical protein
LKERAIELRGNTRAHTLVHTEEISMAGLIKAVKESERRLDRRWDLPVH